MNPLAIFIAIGLSAFIGAILSIVGVILAGGLVRLMGHRRGDAVEQSRGPVTFRDTTITKLGSSSSHIGGTSR